MKILFNKPNNTSHATSVNILLKMPLLYHWSIETTLFFVLFISDNEKDNNDEEDEDEGGENKSGKGDAQSANVNLDEKPVLRPCEDNEWTLICSTVQHWNEIISLYEASTDKNEKILLRGLKELNEVMPDIFEEKVYI